MNNSTSVLNILFRKLRIPVTKASISEELGKHPDYPSFAAISDVLDYWNVPNGAMQVEVDELTQISVPYIVSLSSEGGEFAVLTKIEPDHIYISNGHLQNEKITLEKFKKIFTGGVLVVEKHPDSGEENYSKKKRLEFVESLRYPLIAAIAFIILSNFIAQSWYTNSISLNIIAVALLKTIGLVCSILLLIHSIDANNPFIVQLCNSARSNCNDILSSNAAKLTAYLSWSEVGFFYFGGTWLVVAVNPHVDSVLAVLAWLNVLCLPYSFYSIFYQVVNKKWCVFCLTIQAVFWLEFISFMPYLAFENLNISVSNFANLISCLSFPLLIWVIFKPFLIQSAKLTPLEEQLRKFKYNSSLFRKILHDREPQILLDDQDTIILGNRDAKNTITIVSNPTCLPCAKAHKQLELLMEQKEDLKVQVVFRYIDEEILSHKVAKHLYQLKAENEGILDEALKCWYEKANRGFSTWSSLYPVADTPEDFACLEIQNTWAKKVGVIKTPTLFLNGYKLPQIWQVQDIKYMI